MKKLKDLGLDSKEWSFKQEYQAIDNGFWQPITQPFTQHPYGTWDINCSDIRHTLTMNDSN